MAIEYAFGLLVACVFFVYLVSALLVPDRF
jgi:K+-transporting ATPase KdpF subunit